MLLDPPRAASVVALLVVTAASSLKAQDETILLPYGAGDYAYSIVAHDELAGFEQPDFDVAAWETAVAGFGSEPGICPLNEPATRKTLWPLDTDLLLRRWVVVPPDVTDLRIRFAVDNDALIWVNGAMLTDGLAPHEGCPSTATSRCACPPSGCGRRATSWRYARAIAASPRSSTCRS